MLISMHAGQVGVSSASIKNPESLHVEREREREREREMCSDQPDQTDRSCEDWSFIYVRSLHTFGNKKASNTFVDSYCT
jgi:hypothetical protein